MKNNYEILTKNGKRKYKNINVKYPFIKIKQGFKDESNYILGKIKRSDKIISNQLNLLLLTGFEGNEEDFKNFYHLGQQGKNDKLKNRLRYRRNSIIFPEFFSESIKLTKVKEFKISEKNRNNNSNFKKILRKSILMNKKKKENLTKYEEKIKEMFRERNITNLVSNSSAINTYKNNTNKIINLTSNRNNSLRKENDKEEKLKQIKKIRSLINQKSDDILFHGCHSFQEKTEKKNRIPRINVENGHLSSNKKLVYKTLYLKDPESKLRQKLDEKITHKVNKVFKKYLKKMKSDKAKFKKVLDPLEKGFKSNLKEVSKFTGNSRENIWMKSSTANLISFGDTFQSMDDDIFYKDHKKIMRKYPEIEKAAEIFNPVVKIIRDTSVIKNLEKNEKKIKFIFSDTDSIIRGIKRKFSDNINKKCKSKSQSLISINN